MNFDKYKYSMKWELIVKIFNSFIGKITIALSLVSLLISTPILNIELSRNLIFASTAILLFIFAYIIYLIFIPNILNEYTKIEYVDYMTKKDKDKQISSFTEFNFLENKDLNYLPIYKEKNGNSFKKIHTIAQFTSNNEDSTLQLSHVKYDYYNNENIFVRYIITILLISFFILINYISIEKLFNYITAGGIPQ
jgi:hypothetical protein